MVSHSLRFIARSALLLCIASVSVATFIGGPTPHAEASCSIFDINCEDSTKVNYCNGVNSNSDKYCSLDKGQEIVKNGINNIETKRSFSSYLQDVVAYIMGFLALIGVIYIIYSGFVVLTSAGDEEKVKKAKKTIISIAIGLLLIFLAYSIVTFLIGKNGKGGLINAGVSFEFIPSTYAADTVDPVIANTFDEYKAKIEEITGTMDRDYKVNGKIKESTLLQLRATVVASMKTFPDNEENYNNNLANNVITAIDLVRKAPDSDTYVSDLASTLANFFKNIHIGRITGKATASPQTGNAPLTVSLRAEDVKDPSGVLIPSAKYVWWIKTSEGKKVIQTGPSINYTFNEERNYTVFLDVSSASRNSNKKIDVLPLRTSVDIAVLPRLGNILFYLNGTDVSKADKFKITPVVGRAGVILDATSSLATGGAKIVKTQWDFGNGVTASYDTAPRLERQTYAANGVYKVRLVLTTNEKTVITKDLELQVQDPIASIRTDKYEGYANEDFKFTSILNAGGIALAYEWQIIEADTSKVLYTSKNPIANYRFPRMGRYTVRLKTTTPNGREDTDTASVTINSKDPIVNFTLKPVSSETPNTFLIDATRSYDPDSMENSKLTFSWNIDGERLDLLDSSRNGAMGKYTFNTLGTHKVTLEATNEQGKMASNTMEVNITSLLSVKLISSPRITSVGNPVNLIAESKEATVFEWSFGDGKSDTTQTSRVSHTYMKSGNYDVSLTVRGGNSAGGSNTISRKVYVADSDSPYAVITTKFGSDEIFPTPDACDGKEAAVINRTKTVSFSAENAINVDGTNTGLNYTWKYNGKNSTQREFAYKFDELGCFPISLTVRSQKTGKTSTSSVYVKVENILPTFASISVAPDSTDKDPVVVTVTANNAIDEDGAIVSYLWYYYTDSDPEPQDFRITRTNKTAFVLPRINGKYYFAVTMEDSNGDKVNSDDVRSDRASLTLATDNINTPIITLKTSSTNIIVSEKIDFKATVKNIIQTDITEKAEYKWDYDGDGFYDETTTTSAVSHTYDKPGSYNMKVKATYKGISNTKYQIINVKNNLKPNFEYMAIGKRFVFVNTTIGSATAVKWKLSNGFVSTAKDSFTYEYGADEEPGSLTIEVTDGKETKQFSADLRKDSINEAKVKKDENSVIVFSYPRISEDEIHVSTLGDKVAIYLGESKGKPDRFSIDADIHTDSDLNGDAADDADNKGTDSYTKGTAFILPIDTSVKERTVRLTTYDAAGKVLGNRDVKVILDFASTQEVNTDTKAPAEITENDKVNLEKLKSLISTKAAEQDRVKMMQYLSTLQDSWFDQREKTQTIIDFESYISGLALDDATKTEFLSLLDGFLISDSQTSSDVALAVSVLRSLIPESSSYYKEVAGENGKGGLIDEILSHPTNVTLNKEIGQKILAYIKDDQGIEVKDKIIIKSQLETIIYGGQANVPVNQEAAASANDEDGGILSIIFLVIKIAFGTLAIFIVAIVGLFVFFRISNKNESLNFSDFLIERFSGKKPVEGNIDTKPNTPVLQVTDPLGIVDSTPAVVEVRDPLAETTSRTFSRAGDENHTAPVEEVIPNQTFTPEVVEVASSATESSSVDQTTDSPAVDIPDWLKSSVENVGGAKETSSESS